jgi:hypothetical protein
VLASQEILAPRFGADLRGVFGIGKWSESWDKDGQTLIREEDITGLNDALNGFNRASGLGS